MDAAKHLFNTSSNHPHYQEQLSLTTPEGTCVSFDRRGPIYASAHSNDLPHFYFRRSVDFARVELKDVQVLPHRLNDMTIWGTPLGQGSVDSTAIFELLSRLLPDPDQTAVCIKLRLPPESGEHIAWVEQSLDFIRVAWADDAGTEAAQDHRRVQEVL